MPLKDTKKWMDQYLRAWMRARSFIKANKIPLSWADTKIVSTMDVVKTLKLIGNRYLKTLEDFKKPSKRNLNLHLLENVDFLIKKKCI